MDLKADLYARIPGDGEYEMLFGENANGDIPLSVWQYDASSSASDNFNGGVVQPTLQTGNGRWLRRWQLPSATDPTPIGTIAMYGAASAPTGWLLCDGSAISRTIYSGLFGVISTTYGMGDGSNTFNVPDFRQKFALGKASSGTGSTLGATGGNIDHVHGSALTTGQPSATTSNISLLGVGSAGSGTHTHSLTVPADNPPFLVVNMIIKT